MSDEIDNIRRPYRQSVSKTKFKKFNKKDNRGFRHRLSELEDDEHNQELNLLRNCSIEDLDDPFEDVLFVDETTDLENPQLEVAEANDTEEVNDSILESDVEVESIKE